MFEVTEQAIEMIRDFQKHKEKIPPIRLKLFPGSCGSPTLQMAIGEREETDEIFYIDGLMFLMDTKLFEQVRPVKIDYVRSVSGAGFAISANLSKMVSSESCF